MSTETALFKSLASANVGGLGGWKNPLTGQLIERTLYEMKLLLQIEHFSWEITETDPSFVLLKIHSSFAIGWEKYWFPLDSLIPEMVIIVDVMES